MLSIASFFVHGRRWDENRDGLVGGGKAIIKGAEMKVTTTISEEQAEQYATEAQGLWYAYNLIGRGRVSEWDWCFAYMTGKLPQLVKRLVKEQENE